MSQPRKNVLISLEKRYADSIMNGEKKVELRNRRMNLSIGDSIWIYSKKPHGCVAMKVTVKDIAEDSPKSLWNQYWDVCGINEEEFFTYFNGVKIGYAISLGKMKRLTYPISLEDIRKKETNFHPPQFSKYLIDGTPLLSFLEECLGA